MTNIRITGSGNKFLKLDPRVEYGTLNFDGSVNVKYDPTGIIDVSNNRTMTFKMILDATSGFNHNGLFTFRNTNLISYDSLEGELDGSLFRLDTGSGADAWFLNDHFPIGEVFDVEITKTTNDIGTLKINGITIEKDDTIGIGSSSNTSAIGYCGSGEQDLKNAAVWDFKIYNTDTSDLLHHLRGYPAGNTSDAWVDLAGDASSVQISAPVGYDPTIRNISGTSGNISDLSKKIILTGSPDPFGEFFARWDAEVSSSLVVDGANRVSQWNDIINNWDVSQGTLSNMPTYDSANSRVRFTRSSSQGLIRTIDPSISQPLTQVAVFECLTSGVNQMITYGGGFREAGMWMQNSGPHLYMQTASNTPVNKDGGGNITWTTGEKFICIYKWNGSSSRVYFEGDSTWTSGVRGGCNPGTRGIEGIRMGYGSFGDYFDGYLYELAYADYIVGDNSAEETAIIEHLRSKWNI